MKPTRSLGLAASLALLALSGCESTSKSIDAPTFSQVAGVTRIALSYDTAYFAGDTAQLHARTQPLALVATAYSAGGAEIPGVRYQWTTSDPAIGAIAWDKVVVANSDHATVNAGNNGKVRVTVYSGAFRDSVWVRVRQRLATLGVTPTSALMATGTTLQLTGSAVDSSGSPMPIKWISSKTVKATVDANGLVTGLSVGKTNISAVAAGDTVVVPVEVRSSPLVDSVVVTPVADTIDALGLTTTLTATAFDTAGVAMPGVSMTWRTSDRAIATVDGSGVVTSVARGRVDVTATAGGVSGKAVVRIRQIAASVSITGAPSSMVIGDTLTATCGGVDVNGQPVVGGWDCVWRSLDHAVLGVNGDTATTGSPHGLLQARAVGTTDVIAERGGGTNGGPLVADTVTVTVTDVLDHFLVEAQGGGNIGGQVPGTPFNVQITAKTAGGATVTSFTGTVGVSSNRTASAGLSTSGSFTAGVLASHSVTLTQTGAGATITATSSAGAQTGISNAFGVGTRPTVSSTVPSNAALNVAIGSAVTVNFSASVNATTSSFALECPIGTAKTYTLSASPAASFTLTPTSPMPPGQSCRLTVIAAQVTDASTTVPVASDYVFAFETIPTAGVDTYPQTVIGNMSVQSANVGTPYSATANDVSAESFTITAFDATSAHGGTVSMTTSGPNMGQFVYDPPAGYHGPNDTFTYTITTSGGSASIGTVTMPISGMVWFIDVNAGSNGDGRLSTPFNTLAAFQTINDGTGDHPATNDNIFLYESNTAYVGPVTLLSGQKLIGQDATASLSTISGLTPPSSSASFPSMNTGAPQTLLTSAGNGVNISSGSNTLRGFRIGGVGGVGSVTGVAIGGTSTGTLTVADVAITEGASGGAISIGSGTTMTANIVMDSVRSSGGTNAVSFTNVNGSATLQIVGTTPSNLSGASGATVVVSGGNLSLTVPATVSQANNAAMLSVIGGHSGTITFNNTLTATAGTGLQFNNADGTYNFNGAVTAGTSASQALNINNGSSGAFNLTVGGTAFTNQTGNAVVISNSAPTVDYRGTISKSSVGNGLISINGLTGGTVSFSGALSQTSSPTPAVAAISDSSNTGGTVSFTNATKTLTTSTGGAVNLRNNTGSTVNFTNGGLAITTTSATGFLSSGGGTINVSGSGNSITTTSGGTGLSVQNPTANALTFQSISTSSAANGIIMVNTGSGGLTVTGNTGTPGRCDVGDTTCSGGTISGATGADGAVAGNGIYLSSAPNVSLTRMRVAGTVQNFGLYGNTVSGLSLNTMLFNGTFGTATTEAALGFDELTGNPSIINSSIFPASASFGDGFRILNTTGTALNRLTMTADTVGFTGTNGRNGVNILARGSNTTNVTVQNSTFRGGKNKTFVFTDSVSATTNLIFTNNLIQQGTGTYGAGALAALNIRTSGATTHTDSIAFNTFTNLNNPNNAAFEFNPGLPGLGLSGSVDSYIGHNTWGTSGSANSGPAHNAINIDMRGSGTTRFKVADNAMYEYGDFPFRADAYDDGATATAGNHNGKMDLTFVRNTIQQARSTATFVTGVQLDVGRTSGGAMTMCVNFGVGGLNNMNNSGSTDADTPFDILSNTTGNGSFLKYLNYSGSDTGASGLAEGKLNNLIRAGISSSTFDGFLDVSQAALVTSSTNNASGVVCNLPAAP